MKSLLLGFAITAVLLSACSNNNTQSKDAISKNADSVSVNTQPNNTEAKNPALIDDLVTGYINIKNALANDNGSDAAAAGKQLSGALQKIDVQSFNADQKNIYDDVKDDIKENADHISTNGGKIDHQREHFDMLSKDIYDLVKIFTHSKILYQDHCPMYNDGKGANWLSETKEIENPYFGKKMRDCGAVKEEMK